MRSLDILLHVRPVAGQMPLMLISSQLAMSASQWLSGAYGLPRDAAVADKEAVMGMYSRQAEAAMNSRSQSHLRCHAIDEASQAATC